MRRRIRYMLLMPVLIVQVLSSCSLIDEPDYTSKPVNASLAFTVLSSSNSSPSKTRMSDDVVQDQNNGQRHYRGFSLLALIPFPTQGEIVSSNHPYRLLNGATETAYVKSSGNYGSFFLYKSFTMMRGTASFLAYGKAPVPDGGSKAVYGSLQENIPATQEPADITFSPDPITTITDAQTTAGLLAGYLNYIADAQVTEGSTTLKWAYSTNSELRSFFLNYIGQRNDDTYMLMAGSSANVIAHINALYAGIVGLAFDQGSTEAAIQANILHRIKNYTVTGLTLTFDGETLKSLGVDYPTSIGLPDGAVALQWVSDAFVPQLQTSTTANMNTVSRYCYPAGLYYFVNSRIDTSNKEEDKASYYGGTVDWDEVCSHYEYYPGIVSGNTTAVAIHNPLQYAVARLKMRIKAETDVLTDAYGKTVTVSDTSFPLTGIIVSGQRPVGFDFMPPTPSGEQSHVNDSFIYDSEMKKSNSNDPFYYLSTTEQQIPSTLVLQSYDGEEVTIILEFINNAQDFHSKNGIIYKGSKFYLIGKIQPEEKNNPADHEKRVFTQDYVTEVSVKVVSNSTTKSLENAYNVLPDILGGRLEVGVELTPKWYFATPTTIIL